MKIIQTGETVEISHVQLTNLTLVYERPNADSDDLVLMQHATYWRIRPDGSVFDSVTSVSALEGDAITAADRLMDAAQKAVAKIEDTDDGVAVRTPQDAVALEAAREA